MSSSSGLDPNLSLLFPLQEQLWDKDLNAPLAAGVVTFYDQNSQSVLKPIYTLSGSGPFSDASYIQLPNPLILSSIGTFIDNNGNDIIPYLFPYDGTPGNTTQTLDLYYITVYSAQGVLQFTRQAWPNLTSNEIPSNNNDVINYIPNGQFLLHNNSPVVQSSVTVPAQGGSLANVSLIAQGGWSFQVPTATTSTNTITFSTNTISTNPDVTADPRFNVVVACSNPLLTDTFKDLVVTFPDVNKFATNDLSNNFTLSFQGSNAINPLNVQVRILKYFGSGGSPTTSTDNAFGVGTVALSVTPSLYNIQGLFGNNSNDTLGTNNDDYVQIAIRFPNQTFTATLTDFVLTSGLVEIQGFPITTDAQFLAPSTAGSLPVPNPDGSNMYLPIQLGPEGFIYDSSVIGQIYGAMYASNSAFPLLLCDGSQYLTAGYNATTGVPYSRLHAVLFEPNNGVNIFGNGATYANATYVNSLIILNTNQTGSQTASADVSTTFTITTMFTGAATIGYKALSNASGVVTAIGSTGGINGTPAADGGGGNATGFTIIGSSSGNSGGTLERYYIDIACLADTSLAGKGFVFGNASISFYMWFKVNGSGSDPSLGGTGIQVNLVSSMNAQQVGQVVASVLSGYQATSIATVAASAIAAGSYFYFWANSVQYVVWYTIAGVGTQPSVGGATYIKVALGGSETAAQVASATSRAINGVYFAVPNLQGYFLRGSDPSTFIDLTASHRGSYGSNYSGNTYGTFQPNEILSHAHPPSSGNSFVVNGSSGTTITGSGFINSFANTGLTGGTESRPYNASVNWFIRY